MQDSYFGYKSIDKSLTQAKEFAMIENGSTDSNDPKNTDPEDFDTANGYKKARGSQKTSGYKKVQKKQAQEISELDAIMSEDHADFSTEKPQKNR